MTFESIEKSISNLLSADGYARYAQGMFGRRMTPESYSWISITGNDYFLTPAIGVVFPKLNDLMYKLQESVLPGISDYKLPSRMGPPFIFMPLRALVHASHPDLQLSWESPSKPLADDVVDELYSHLKDEAFAFFTENTTLERAVVAVETYCKFGQSQKYLYPIALYLTKSAENIIRDYVVAVSNTFSDVAIKASYEAFIAEVNLYFLGGELERGGL